MVSRNSSGSSLLKFRFPVKRAFKALDDGQRVKWVLVVAANDLPLDLPLDANARVPNVIKNETCREQRETLLTTPELFQTFNGGIICTSTQVSIHQDGNTHIAEVLFDGETEQGIVNGGHTYANCLLVCHGVDAYSDDKDLITVLAHDLRRGSKKMEDLVLRDGLLAERVARAREKAHVQIELVAPVDDTELLAQIARARNLSQSVEATALINLAGKFDLMKKVLDKEFGPILANRVVWKTNQEVDEPAISARQLIELMAMMNARIYPPGQKVTNEVYTRTGLVVRDFSEAEGDYKHYYDALTGLLPHMIRLYDHIYGALPETDSSFPWADGKYDKEVKKRRTTVVTPLLGQPCASKVAKAFIYPIYAALRLLLTTQSEGELRFHADPIEFFDEMKGSLAAAVKGFHQQHRVVNQIGKDKELWVRLEGIIETELKVRARLGEKARA